MTFKKIVVAMDRSFQAPFVFEQALDQAKTEGSNLILVHSVRLEPVLQSNSFLGIGTLGDIDVYGDFYHMQQKRLHQEMESSQEWLQTYVQQASDRGIPTRIDCKPVEAGLHICSVAENWGADLIVIGRRGYRGIKAVALGSVSSYVINHAPCSVLVVQ